MKQDDFERLKAICEKEGFDISKGSIGDIDGWFVINKKTDPWEGVEFVECVSSCGNQFTFGKIYKVHRIIYNAIETLSDDSGNFNGWGKDRFKPSTETAYVKQLKNEAFERFGEIKEGDRFREPNGSDTKADNGFKEFEYNKPSDSLYFMCVGLYEKGKWAERVKDRVKVESMLIIRNGDSELHEFTFKSSKRDIPLSAGEFLASQLEKYLNGEIE